MIGKLTGKSPFPLGVLEVGLQRGTFNTLRIIYKV